MSKKTHIEINNPSELLRKAFRTFDPVGEFIDTGDEILAAVPDYATQQQIKQLEELTRTNPGLVIELTILTCEHDLYTQGESLMIADGETRQMK